MILRDIKKLASKTVLALLSFGLLAGIAGCTQTQESYSVSDLSTKGYVVTEVADGGFYITENDVDYYFESNMYGKPAFITGYSEEPEQEGEYIRICEQLMEKMDLQAESIYRISRTDYSSNCQAA